MTTDVSRRTALRAALAAGLLLPFAPALGGCGAGASPAAAGQTRSDRPRAAADPATIPAAVASLTAAGGALWARLATDATKNSTFSPYSLQVALAMIRFGAVGPTGAGLDRVLATTDHVRLAAGLNALTSELATRNGEFDRPGPRPGDTGTVRLDVANAVWAQQGLAWERGFLDALAGYFDAGVSPADYRAHAAEAIAAINNWCAQATHGVIPEIVTDQQVTDMTRLVLANAVYLKADWKYPFDKGLTAERPFTTASGATVSVPTMHGHVVLPTRRSQGWQAASPYAGDKIAMLALLPDRGREAQVGSLVRSAGLAALLQGWDHSRSPLSAPQREGEGAAQVVLPKFRIASTHDLGTAADPVSPLRVLGADLAFSDGADFSGLTRTEPLKLQFATQKATIVVDELGTEAAAVTAIGAMAMSAPPVLRFDRPFYAIVYDVPTATPLFLTYVADPSRR